MKHKFIFPAIAAVLLFASTPSSAQINEFTGWGAWFHTQKFSKHWGGLFDLQLRSAPGFGYVRNPLIRPAVSYYFNSSKFASVGYLFTGTKRYDAAESIFRVEQRVFEQFIINHKLGSSNSFQHRFRLEQRFVNSQGNQEQFFAQRFRYFARGVFPFKKDSVFTKGTFIGLQNEVFVNVQNKAKLNGQFFDQNRAYAAIGYRLNKKIDLETGYLNQYINQVGGYTFNHVVQVALYTRF
ncbi:MAG: DUF2490 domain-containing protein [Sphingobacteriaceae bacterium]|nr:MAG: DUF2490 domain-containing protein [Sphingobacteriaceae bacterium]